MHSIARLVVTASWIAAGLALAGPSMAQTKDAAPRVEAGAKADDTKQVTLTQSQIDGLLGAQKEMRAIEDKMSEGNADKPDPMADAKLESIAKKNGFSSLDEYASVGASVGMVMAGMDPDTKTFVGPGGNIKKQIAEVQADKTMKPNDKTEALAELNAALETGDSVKPLPGNVDLVAKNFDKLFKGLRAD